MGRGNKAEFAGHTFFGNIFTYMNNYIWQFLIFTGVDFTA